MAEFFDFLQIALDFSDGNRANLPILLYSDALQRRRTAESNRQFKHRLAVQSFLLQVDYLVDQQPVRASYNIIIILGNVIFVMLYFMSKSKELRMKKLMIYEIR